MYQPEHYRSIFHVVFSLAKIQRWGGTTIVMPYTFKTNQHGRKETLFLHFFFYCCPCFRFNFESLLDTYNSAEKLTPIWALQLKNSQLILYAVKHMFNKLIQSENISLNRKSKYCSKIANLPKCWYLICLRRFIKKITCLNQ